MPQSKFTKRAQDKLDLFVVIDFYLYKIKNSCKGSIAHAVSTRVERLRDKKKILENMLDCLNCKCGFIKRFIQLREIRKIKQQLSDINNSIVDWINSVYCYFVSPKKTTENAEKLIT